MLTSLALIFLAGLAMAALCSLLRLPRIIGMLFTGILLGPYVLGLLDPSILAISARPAADGTHHHSHQGRTFAGSRRSAPGGMSGCAHVLPACQL